VGGEKGRYLGFRILCERIEKAFKDRFERLISWAFVQGVDEGSRLGTSIGTASKTQLSGKTKISFSQVIVWLSLSQLRKGEREDSRGFSFPFISQ
jgi:hypothetical protein